MADPKLISVVYKPPLEELRRRFALRRSELGNFAVPYRKCAIFLDSWVQRNFKSEGGNVGGWQKLKAGGRWHTTPGGKRSFDANAKILQDTGRLRISFIPFANTSGAGIGSDVPYSIYHEEGQGVPQRRMLPKKNEVLDDTREIFNAHVTSVAKRGLQP